MIGIRIGGLAMNNNDQSKLPFNASKPTNIKMIGLFLFLIAIAIMNYFLFTHSPKKEEQKEIENYTLPTLKTTQAWQEKSKAVNLQGNFEHNEAMIKQKLTEAKAKEFVNRLQASQHESGNIAPIVAGENKQTEGSDYPKLTDSNKAFLAEASNSKAEHVYASYLRPLPYIVGQGKYIFATLSTAINSDLPGPIEAVVSQDVYGEQGRKVLIPRGSKLIGEYKSGLVNHQSRLFVVWTRIKEPNGVDVQVGSPGTDTLGRAGLTGYIDNHYMARYLSATLIAIIGAGAATSGVSSTDQFNSTAFYRQNISQALTTQASDSLSQNMNIPPTINKPQGEPVIVFVNRDLDFSRIYQS